MRNNIHYLFRNGAVRQRNSEMGPNCAKCASVCFAMVGRGSIRVGVVGGSGSIDDRYPEGGYGGYRARGQARSTQALLAPSG